MKKTIAILCILCMAQVSYAALDRNYFEYDLAPNGSYTEEENTVNVNSQTTTVQEGTKKTKVIRKRRGFKGTGSSQSNTYWNFGQPNYGFTGDIQ